MVRLSVIIVNYNVKHFLEQALVSAQKAAERMETEIIVVDNHSVDGSMELVERRFPEVKLIRNEENVGFARANNQGMKLATGEYLLLLNPDTVVEEDTFDKVLAFMDSHPEAGGLGVKMLDGKGEFLPESKRSFPSPAVAFWKAFGMSTLFPRSRTFGRYHLGHLHEDQIHEVEVLAGAFMLLRSSVIDEIGGLDESFFMYGEDIDLSYRIVQAGYKNYYFPETRIIHYKGESTKKGSLNYVRMFYAAMKIFARKHFSGGSARIYIALINLAIYLRAGMALLNRLLRRLALPILDAAAAFGGMVLIKNFWEDNIKGLEGVYPPEYLAINVPIYIAIWLASVFVSGGYDRDAKASRIVRGLAFGTLIIAALYGFLPEHLRFSRGMILSGAVWTAGTMVALRLAWNFFRHGNFRLGESSAIKVVIVGKEKEALRVQGLLDRYEVDADLVGFVRTDSSDFQDDRLLGGLAELPDIVKVFDLDELIFCGKDLASADIIGWMTRLGPSLDYKIVPREALSIVGSNSKNTAGDLYSIDIHLAIDEPRSRRNKRLFDIGLSTALIVTLPIQLAVVRKPGGMLRNALAVLSGSRSWVGYHPSVEAARSGSPDSSPPLPGTRGIGKLPELRQGVLSPLDGLSGNSLGPKTVSRLNLLYARDYEATKDWSIVWRRWRELGRTRA